MGEAAPLLIPDKGNQIIEFAGIFKGLFQGAVETGGDDQGIGRIIPLLAHHAGETGKKIMKEVGRVIGVDKPFKRSVKNVRAFRIQICEILGDMLQIDFGIGFFPHRTTLRQPFNVVGVANRAANVAHVSIVGHLVKE